MQQFEHLLEYLDHDNLDKTIILTFSRTGSWMGPRDQEFFQLTGDGTFLWEWEDVHLRIPYQKQARTLDKHITSILFDLFRSGLPSLHPLQQGQPLPALPPDSIPAYFNITIGDQQASYMYLPSPASSDIKHLLDELTRLRKL